MGLYLALFVGLDEEVSVAWPIWLRPSRSWPVTGGVVGGSANATLGGVATHGGGAFGVAPPTLSLMGTLGSAAGGRGAITVGTVGGKGEQSAVVAWAKKSASWKRAWHWLSMSGANGEASPEWSSASMRSRAAAEASSAVDALGMETCDGYQERVLATHSNVVSVIQTR
eukprot:scaffold11894_cov53-Attheya_sp.AAC.4